MEAVYKLFWAEHLLVVLWLGFVFNLKDIRNLKMVAWREHEEGRRGLGALFGRKGVC